MEKIDLEGKKLVILAIFLLLREAPFTLGMPKNSVSVCLFVCLCHFLAIFAGGIWRCDMEK